jgi:hypothetical protein
VANIRNSIEAIARQGIDAEKSGKKWRKAAPKGKKKEFKFKNSEFFYSLQKGKREKKTLNPEISRLSRKPNVGSVK